jgi:hypothetical protein
MWDPSPESGKSKNWHRILSIGFRGVSAEFLQRGDDADEDVGVPRENFSPREGREGSGINS